MGRMVESEVFAQEQETRRSICLLYPNMNKSQPAFMHAIAVNHDAPLSHGWALQIEDVTTSLPPLYMVTIIRQTER
ncbi:hypothetical protein TNCV_3098381 [Trichonephila clavipes]|nr:hypothetical protein TNCV_3098381 [Trichonephila clavipes]